MPAPCMSQPQNIAAQTPMAPTERFRPPVTITDHHGEADHDVDADRPAEGEEAEGREEARARGREDDREDHDQHDQAELVAEAGTA